ncbi:MAG: hypothetical protein NC938_07570 [Candidatus Omnitrophica bacterium]|nr:hypothetical protein [Candidatus Omnitrophota bacterium]MCM8791523.1 hypothetical protein [Candidatus Omnitrophota bacterium]
MQSALRETTRDVRGKVEEKLEERPTKPPQLKEEIAEEVVEGPKFLAKKIELVGVKSFPVEEFSKLVQKYENREVSIAELKILAKEIERDYLRKGVIAACFIPPQDVKEGVVSMRVVEAKMGELQIKQGKYFSKKRTEYYWRIPENEVLRYDRISRSLQFMNKNPDRNVKAALHAGKKPETTDVLLDVATNFPLHVTATLDNEGAPSTGKIRSGVGFVENNFVGLDDTLLGGYTGGKNFGGIYVYHRVPITNFGTTILYGYSQTRSFPKKDYAPFEISSRQENYSVFLYQDLFYKDEYKGEVSAGVDMSNKRVVSGAGGDLNVDRLRVLSGSFTLIGKGMGNSTSIKPSIYQGLNWLGARRQSRFSSRQAQNTFTKATLNMNFRQALVKNFQASVKFNGQWASEKLMPQQEMYLGGIDSIRGYPSGDYLADSGFYSNWELLVPAFFLPEWVRIPYGERPLKDEITGVVFFDWGYGMKRGNIQGEQTSRRMASVGIGGRVRLLNQAMLRVEWGAPLDPLVNGPLTEWSRSRVHVSLDFQDDLPEEVERFQKVQKEEYMKDAAWKIVNDEMKNPNSPLRAAIYKYFAKAKHAQAKGDLESARENYGKVISIGENVYRQAEAYVRESYKQIDALHKLEEEAQEYLKKGDVAKAKEAWHKIIEEGKPKPLVLEFI